MKELRLNFSDYPASEQERDAQKAKKPLRHVYLMRVDGEWAHFIVTQRGDDYKFYGDKSLTDVYYELKENYPDYKPRVLKNEGLENYLRDRKPKDLQLRIPFNEMQSMSKGTSRE
jgi:hypothetical protein